MPKFDPVASLRIWAVEVGVAGLTLRIPPLPASDWLPALMRTDVLALLELAEDVDIDELLLGGTLTAAELVEALEKLLESAAGRTPWAAMMLAAVASEHWHVIGADLARVGVSFDRISIGAALDAIYGSLCRSMDEKGIARFNNELDRPRTGATKAATEQPPGPRGAQPLPANAEQYVRVRPKTRLRRPQDRQDALSVEPTQPLELPARGDLVASGVPPSAPHPQPE